MWQSEDSMQDFVSTALLKSLGMVLFVRLHVQNAQGTTLDFCILTKLRMATIPTHSTIRSPMTKVTNLQPTPHRLHEDKKWSTHYVYIVHYKTQMS